MYVWRNILWQMRDNLSLLCSPLIFQFIQLFSCLVVVVYFSKGCLFPRHGHLEKKKSKQKIWRGCLMWGAFGPWRTTTTTTTTKSHDGNNETHSSRVNQGQSGCRKTMKNKTREKRQKKKKKKESRNVNHGCERTSNNEYERRVRDTQRSTLSRTSKRKCSYDCTNNGTVVKAPHPYTGRREKNKMKKIDRTSENKMRQQR